MLGWGLSSISRWSIVRVLPISQLTTRKIDFHTIRMLAILYSLYYKGKNCVVVNQEFHYEKYLYSSYVEKRWSNWIMLAISKWSISEFIRRGGANIKDIKFLKIWVINSESLSQFTCGNKRVNFKILKAICKCGAGDFSLISIGIQQIPAL